MNAFAEGVGWCVMTISSLVVVVWISWYCVDIVIRRLKLLWWFCLYVYHGKQFRQWCKEHRDDLPELHRNMVSLGEGDGSGTHE